MAGKKKKRYTRRSSTIRKTAVVFVVLIAVLAGIVSLPARRTTETSATAQGTTESSATENTADTSSPSSATEQSTEQSPEQTVTEPQEPRLIFVGDSRTIDMFADSDEPLEGEEHDGVLVYARHGHAYDYLESLVTGIGVNEKDTLVTWMGANDRGIFPPYGALYNRLLEEGVRLIVCTVGPTGSDLVEVWYNEPYANEYMQQFNRDLMTWAAANDVPVIDLYTYVSRNVEIDMSDGVHYLPRPDPVLWGYILEKLQAYGVLQSG